MYKRVKDNYTDDSRKYREYADVYVGDKQEGLSLDTDDYVQGSKLYVVETAELYVLNRAGGSWCSVVDGTPLM